MQLEGGTALVTGASRGIGRAIALALAAEGADVAANDVSSEATAKEVVDEVQRMGRRAFLAQADVADYPDTFRMAQNILKEFGHLDILINNAGSPPTRRSSRWTTRRGAACSPSTSTACSTAPRSSSTR